MRRDKELMKKSSGFRADTEPKTVGKDAKLIKRNILFDLTVLGKYMYDQIMAGSEVRDDLYQMIMEALPVCFERLNTSSDSLEKLLAKTRSVVCQVEAEVSVEDIQLEIDPSLEIALRTGEENNDSEKTTGPDLDCLRNLLKKSLQCAAWYALRAHMLGADLREYRDGFVVGLHALGDCTLGLGGLTSRVLEGGQLVSACAAMHTEIARSNLGGRKVQSVKIVQPVSGSLIIHGSDLLVLKALLETAQIQGVSVYTSGGLASAYGYEDIASSSSLAGHVSLRDEDVDISGCTLLLTDFLPDNLESLTVSNIFVSGLAGWDGARSVDDLSNEESISVFWNRLKRADSAAEPKVQDSFETGWDYTALMEKMDSFLSGLQTGSISSVDLLVMPSEVQVDRYGMENESGHLASLKLTAGGPVTQELFMNTDARLPNPVHVGEAADILEGVRLFQALANQVHSPVHALPTRIEFPCYREEFIGLLFGLMSFGLRGFWLGKEWRSVITARVLEMLEDRWHVQIEA